MWLLGAETRERAENPTRVSRAGTTAAGKGPCAENTVGGVDSAGNTSGGEGSSAGVEGSGTGVVAGAGGEVLCAQASEVHTNSGSKSKKSILAAVFTARGQNRVPIKPINRDGVPERLLTPVSPFSSGHKGIMAGREQKAIRWGPESVQRENPDAPAPL